MLGADYSDDQRAPMPDPGGRCDGPAMEIRRPPPLTRTDEPPQIDTPLIDMQDLEHQPAAQILPELDLSREDEKARKAIEEFERSLRRQPPG